MSMDVVWMENIISGPLYYLKFFQALLTTILIFRLHLMVAKVFFILSKTIFF